MAKRTLDDFWTHLVDQARAEGPDAMEQLGDFSHAYEWARELALARKSKKMSQVRASQLSGIPQSEISRMEGGLANPTLATTQRLASVYGLQLVFVPRDTTRGRSEKSGRRHAASRVGTFKTRKKLLPAAVKRAKESRRPARRGA